ncbi:maleylpyruvate isomerase N-terminal domain-containing protein [Salininema proteolyticum]|uniref:Maleylpyruvate isomerase N-terminal domain-containing protein n=1 Tax=Salininema proteolyticum TaxID=1607685 RepID=A0ABV8U316_9ACTN
MNEKRDLFLSTAEVYLDYLERPAVAAKWTEPSALDEFTVAGLAGHTSSQITSAAAALAAEGDERPGKDLFDHYAQAAWATTGIDSEANTGIRDSGENLAAAGHKELCATTREALEQVRTALPSAPADSRGATSTWDYTLPLDDYLVTRTVELVVHGDDLAHSLPADPPAYPQAAYDLTFHVLTRLAAARHGNSALIGALARSERAPGTVAAF